MPQITSTLEIGQGRTQPPAALFAGAPGGAGSRIVSGVDGFTVLSLWVEPPRAVSGLAGVDLGQIEAALGTPPREAAPTMTSRRLADIDGEIGDIVAGLTDVEIATLIGAVGLDRTWTIFDAITSPGSARAAE